MRCDWGADSDSTKAYQLVDNHVGPNNTRSQSIHSTLRRWEAYLWRPDLCICRSIHMAAAIAMSAAAAVAFIVIAYACMRAKQLECTSS